MPDAPGSFRVRKFLLLALLPWALRPASVLAQDAETWNAHFQVTTVGQFQPSFHSPYAGANSLSARGGLSESLTATAAVGGRVATGTELWIDPELAQGKPVSGLVGLAGFPNGELAKTSSRIPTPYIARAFLRETLDLGGAPVAQESDVDQLRGNVSSRRLVITAGRISLLDVFDANPVAHDPRSQFMNWVLMTHGAWDYAADARGYSDGLAVELVEDAWALRAGRFALPRQPNGLALDGRLGIHHGDQVELAHTHELAGRAGSVRVLAFRDRARMVAWDDALAAAPAGQAPSLDDGLAREHAKTGFGIDVDQALAADLSAFVRALRADGRTGTEAFAESDASLSTGLALTGARWSRPRDTLGIAAAADAISDAHRAYLARGGMGAFVGDGALRYGPERILEAYYNAAIGAGFSLTADVQRIANPGYNKDRGPASAVALRLHWES